MTETEKYLKGFSRYNDILEFRDSLNLTDRQKEIFMLRYSRGLSRVRIGLALEPQITERTVAEELRIIRTKTAECLLK